MNKRKDSHYKNIQTDIQSELEHRKKLRKIKNKQKFFGLIAIVIFTVTLLFVFSQKSEPATSFPGSTPDLTTYAAQPLTSQPNKTNLSVVIDPGHGGFDIGKESGTGKNEYILNLSVSMKIGEILENAGITPIYTRTTNDALASNKEDDMQKRVDITNSSGANLFISIHMNSFIENSSIKGPEIYYYEGTSAKSLSSITLADTLQEKLNSFTGCSRSSRHENLMVIREANIPAILIECGYMSNKQEEIQLNDENYQKQIAGVIANTIIEYLNA